MQRGIIFVVGLFLFSSCCKKVYPSQSTQISDSTILKVENYSKQIFVPVNMKFQARLNDIPKNVFIDTMITNRSGEKASVKLGSGLLKISCNTDSLKIIIDSLKKITFTRIKTVTTVKNNVIEKKVISGWSYVLLGMSITFAIFGFIKSFRT